MSFVLCYTESLDAGASRGEKKIARPPFEHPQPVGAKLSPIGEAIRVLPQRVPLRGCGDAHAPGGHVLLTQAGTAADKAFAASLQTVAISAKDACKSTG
jgi:hypothetical protein